MTHAGGWGFMPSHRCGKVTDAGGTSAAIDDGQTGLLVAKEDEGALADATERLLTDRSLAAKLASQALARARSRFAWPPIVERLLAVLAVGYPFGLLRFARDAADAAVVRALLGRRRPASAAGG